MERILAVQAQPKSLLQTLADEGRQLLSPLLEDPPVTARPTTLYQPLCAKEPSGHEEDPNVPPPDRPTGPA